MSAQPPDEWAREETPGKPRPGRNGKGKISRPPLDEAAEEIRAIWIEAIRAYLFLQHGFRSNYDSKPVWDGGRCPDTSRTYSKPIWPQIVAKAKAEGYSPRELIACLFEGWVNDQAPTPNLVTGDNNLRKAALNRMRRKQSIADSLRREEAVFKSDFWGVNQSIPDPREAARFVLNDVSRPISPLFRYSVALIRELPDVADRWKDAATAQFLADARSYLEYWSALIPQHLKDAVQTTAA